MRKTEGEKLKLKQSWAEMQVPGLPHGVKLFWSDPPLQTRSSMDKFHDLENILTDSKLRFLYSFLKIEVKFMPYELNY